MPRQNLLESVTGIIRKCGSCFKVKQKVITKCDRYYNRNRKLLQSVTDITNCDANLLRRVTIKSVTITAM